jgi:hypothetical protein
VQDVVASKNRGFIIKAWAMLQDEMAEFVSSRKSLDRELPLRCD